MKTYYLILPRDEKGDVWKGQELDEMSAKVTLSIALSNLKKDEVSMQIVRHNADIIQKLMERSD